MKPHAPHPDRPLYNPDQPSWWTPSRQRVIVLTFNTPEEAAAWDQCPDLDHLEPTE